MPSALLLKWATSSLIELSTSLHSDCKSPKPR